MTEHHDVRGAYDVPEGARELVRPPTDPEKELPCFVNHPGAGGRCGRPGFVRVYGLSFCEIHGEEAAGGALEELYDDATTFFERSRNPHVPVLNPLLDRELEAAAGRLADLSGKASWARDDALRRAYPLIPSRACLATLEHDPDDPGAPPYDVYLDARNLLHKLMRLAFEDGADWLVEVLEHEREGVAAQAAFALVLRERARAGTPVPRPAPKPGEDGATS